MADLHLQSTSGESDNGRDESNKNQQNALKKKTT